MKTKRKLKSEIEAYRQKLRRLKQDNDDLSKMLYEQIKQQDLLLYLILADINSKLEKLKDNDISGFEDRYSIGITHCTNVIDKKLEEIRDHFYNVKQDVEGGR